MEQTTITGFIGRDAAVKHENDLYTINFSVACSKKYLDKERNEVEKTTWYSVFKRSKKNPEKLVSYLKKGQKVLIQGEPSYSIDQSNQQIKVGVILNCEKLEILTFNDSEND